MTPGNSRRRPKGNERERSVSVVKLGTLRYAASTAKLTDSRQRDVVTYNQGKSSSFIGLPWDLFAEESRKSAFKSGEQWEVLRRQEGSVIVGKDGVEKQLPVDRTRKFSVFEREKITISIGDRIRFTKNVKHRGQKFLNNELRTVVGIESPVTPASPRPSTRSLPACRFGRSAKRTRHNFMSRCRVRGGLCMSLLIVR